MIFMHVALFCIYCHCLAARCQTSEDCLYLDIYIPRGGAANATAGWPVMVYIHGGNFVHISGSSPLFDGRKLAGAKGVIQVNINYRMGRWMTGQHHG